MTNRRARWGLLAGLVAVGLGLGPRVTWAQATGSITGHVTASGDAGVAGVVVAISDGTSTIQRTTDGTGAFSATGLGPASYTVTPTLAGHDLTPAARTITLLGDSAIADFVASTPAFAVAGRVVDANGSPLGGVAVALSGDASATTTTDAGGGYRFAGLSAGVSVTITPTLAGFVFAPAARTAADVRADVTLPAIAAASGLYRRYFAEGASNGFFSTRIALLNPGTTPTTAHLRFQKSDGRIVDHDVVVAGLARVSIDPAAVGVANSDFATVVESSQPLVADRTMHWDATGYGSHAETSLSEPLTTWYFAEGSTTGSFNLFYLLQNPGATPAQVEIRYLRPAPAAPIVKTYTVAPASRRTLYVNQEDPALDETDVSAVVTVTNGVPIVAERSMYTNARGQVFGAGHESAGVGAPSAQWFLAEGATGPFFNQFILVANPTATAAPLEFRYLLTDGRVIVKSHTVAANSRLTVGVHAEDPQLAAASMSTVITSTQGVPVLVERAMWWPASGPEWYEAHDSSGATATGTKWAVADGEAGGVAGADTFLLIANTASRAGSAAVTLVFEDGGTATKTFALLPSSRSTVPVSGAFPEAIGRRFGAIVESVGPAPVPIVVERAIYESPGGVVWAAGSNLLATRLRGPIEAAVIPPPSAPATESTQVTTAGVLGGDPETPAPLAIPDVVAEVSAPASEISTRDDGEPVVRTKLEIAFRRTATVGQINAVLGAIDGRIVNALAGVPIVVVRIPDPGSLTVLDALVVTVAAQPAVASVVTVALPAARSLPETHPSTGPLDTIDHLLADRAPAAWNVRNALESPRAEIPLAIVTDSFGAGPPNSAIDASLVSGDFERGGLDPHGYHVLGTIAGTFPSTAVNAAANVVVGLFPHRLDVRVVDMTGPEGLYIDIPSYLNAMLRMVRWTSRHVVVNSSVGPTRPYALAQAARVGAIWAEKVRTAGFFGGSLEGQFVHAVAAGNNAAVPQGVFAAVDSEAGAATLIANLVDASGTAVPNLTNTLLVENRFNTPTAPFEPACRKNTSDIGGNIAAIGTAVYSLTNPGSTAASDNGTSMASPQVAALATFLWALAPSLSSSDVVARLKATSRAGVPLTHTDCSTVAFASAPSIDAYAAVLSADNGLTSPLVRSTLLDVTGPAGGDVPDGRFDERDVQRFVTEFDTRAGTLSDYSRFDLNGNGRTGGPTTDRFDLDANPIPAWTMLTESVDGEQVTFVETTLTDLQILCYYAFSPLYVGSVSARTTLLPACHSGQDMRSLSGIQTSMAAVNPLTSTFVVQVDDHAASTDAMFRPSIGRPISDQFSPNDPAGPNPSTYTVSATSSMPTPTRPAFLPATGTFTGDVACQASGAGIDDGTGHTVLPVLPRLSASTNGTFDVSTRLDGQHETPSMTVDLSGFLSRGTGSGDINSGVSLSGTMVISGLSGGVTLPDVRIAVRNYSTPSDTLPIQEPVAYRVTVTSPGYVEVHWNLDATCAVPPRAATEGASGSFQLHYSVTH